MVVMSKQLYESLGDIVSCEQLHWAFGKSCRRFVWTFYSNIFIGCVKIFFPISIVQVFLNYKQLKGPLYAEFLKTFIRRSSFVFLSGCWFFSWPCLMSNCFGRVRYYDVAFLSGLLASFFSLIGTRSARILDSILCVNMVLETFIKRAQYHDIFKVTARRLTTLFVINNALLMFLITHRNRERKSSIYWLYIPPTVQENEYKLGCAHKNGCFEYCFEGTLKYVLIGYSWDIIRKILTKNVLLLKQPQLLIELITSSENLNFGLFLSTYVGIYRAITCYLCGRRNSKQLYYPVIAGLLSGLSYGIQPNIQILCLAVTASLQLLYGELEEKYTLLKKVPTLLLLFATCHSILAHERINSPDICSKGYMNMTSLLTSGQVDKLCDTMYQNATRTIR